MNKYKSIKGLTLIEVVVALSIFAIVFGGTATLITSVVNLAMVSKERTEATTFAQKGLAQRIRSLNYGCDVQYNETFPEPDWSKNGSYKLTTTVKSGYFQDNGSGALEFTESATTTDFLEITSTINWTSKFGPEKEEITQIIRKQ